MKRILVMIVVLLAFCVFIPGSFSEEAKWEGMSWLHKQYGYKMNQDFIDEMKEEFQEATFNCGLVQITLKEILYDGVWMYTSAIASPTVSDDIIILPSSADVGDYIAGGYNEGMRNDHRSFLEVAKDDHKNLLWVQAFPDEFLDADFFFTDHRQDAGEQSTLFSGAPVMLDDSVNNLHFTVETNLISSLTGEILSSDMYTFPVSFHTSSSQHREYYSSTNDTPFDRVTLLKTPLATHVFPGNDVKTEYVLLDEEGNEYRSAIPEDTTSIITNDLPTTLIIRFYNDNSESHDVMFFSER